MREKESDADSTQRDRDRDRVQQGSDFPQTRWSLVSRADASEEASTLACDAMQTLCAAYWYPLYCFVRRQGHNREEAEDLTQMFFARCLQKSTFRMADPKKRFRTFLLAALKNFSVSEWRKGQTAKRNAGLLISLNVDPDDAERRYAAEPADGRSPDKIYEKQWAQALLSQVMKRVRDEYTAKDRKVLFDQLAATIWGTAKIAYAQIAAELGMKENAVGMAAHRLKLRYSEVLREEVAHTLADPSNVDEELRHLLQCITE